MAVGTVRPRNHHPSGFTLIELAIVLTILSLTVGGALAVTAAKLENGRYKQTLSKLQFILQAVDDYVDEKASDTRGHIPCPADPQAAFTASTFGFGSYSGSACNASNIVGGTDGAEAGAVPVVTLNIPHGYTLDGWNRRITYVMDEDLCCSEANYDGATGSITVENASGTDYTTTAAVVVFSHGPNLFGSWPARGGSAGQYSKTDGGPDEDENADLNDSLFVQTLLSGSYDDVLVYRAKWQLDGTE